MIKRLTIQIVQVMQTLLIDYAFIQSIFIFSHGGLHMKNDIFKIQILNRAQE